MSKRPDYIGMVREFHKAFHHPAPTNILSVSVEDDTRTLRKNLNTEEALESITALLQEEPDLVDLADGLSDLIYVAAGAAVVAGTQVVAPTVLIRSWPDTSEDTIFEMITLLTLSVFRLNRAIEKKSHTNWGDLTKTVIEACEAVAKHFKIPLWECFDEVHASNMSKLWPNGKPKFYASGKKKGKVRKGPKFKEPDLERILKEYGTIK